MALKSFKSRYKMICGISKNWKREYSSLDEMKTKIDSVVKDLDELECELEDEKSLIEDVKRSPEINNKSNQEVQCDRSYFYKKY